MGDSACNYGGKGLSTSQEAITGVGQFLTHLSTSLDKNIIELEFLRALEATNYLNLLDFRPG